MDLNLDPWHPADPDSASAQVRRFARSRRQTRLLKLASDVQLLDMHMDVKKPVGIKPSKGCTRTAGQSFR